MPSGSAAADDDRDAAVPLCVDLDGSLIRTDLLWESFGAAVRTWPADLARVVGWLGQGRAALKAGLAGRADLDVAQLPYRADVLAFLRAEKAGGRTLVLATAADARLAEAVAGSLGLFDAVVASDGAVNLKGRHKRDALVRRYGVRGFDYLGDSTADLPVWEAARGALVVGSDPTLVREAGHRCPVVATFPDPVPGWRGWVRQLRVHQWAKNALVVVPMVAAHRVGEPRTLAATAVAVLAFCAAASAIYLLNDLIDLPSDRAHARKRHRPLAAGVIGIPRALAVAAGLVGLAAALTALLPGEFAVWLGLYGATAVAYSLAIKRLLMVDVMCLAGLYTVRILAGGGATGIVISPWLLAFSLFFFLGLALLKRYTELRGVADGPANARLPGRGYHAEDAEMIRSLGPASSYLAVLVICLYINDPASVTLYRHPRWLLLICPLLLYWTSRLWLLAHRGRMHVDPVVFALGDRKSQLTGILVGLILAAAAWL